MNPKFDTGAPTSTGGTDKASSICQRLGITLKLSPPHAVYYHGWGTKCDQAKQIRHTWYLTIFDVHGKATTISFNLVKRSSPLIIGLDEEKFAGTRNMDSKK